MKDWTAAEREAMRQSVRTLGLRTPVPGGRSMQDLALDVLAIARTGLKNRANLGPSGDDETGYLHELEAIARSGKTPAERLLDRYYGDWNRDVRRVFSEQAY
ncbi:MAG: hypothetical protein R3C04_03065 [Hyphomonas sp.]